MGLNKSGPILDLEFATLSEVVQSLGIVVGGKGRGSNMRRLVEACQSDELLAEVRCVVVPSLNLPAVDIARSLGITVRLAEPGDTGAMIDALADVDWVCLAGYLRLLPNEVLRAHPKRVINIHPSLLPKFGGKGMYGMAVQRAVLEAGEAEAGCSVHYVSEQYDEGEIILRESCPVDPGMSPEALADRVLECELRAYPAALKMVLNV